MQSQETIVDEVEEVGATYSSDGEDDVGFYKNTENTKEATEP